MRRGCISLGDVQCDECHRIIPCPERYLVTDEAEGTTRRLCLNCSISKGYAHYSEEKGQRVITLLTEKP
jgi:hypothetical protein